MTTFLERRIIGMIHGEKERHLQAMGEWRCNSQRICPVDNSSLFRWLEGSEGCCELHQGTLL